jgi:hypothetical protein
LDDYATVDAAFLGVEFCGILLRVLAQKDAARLTSMETAAFDDAGGRLLISLISLISLFSHVLVHRTTLWIEGFV